MSKPDTAYHDGLEPPNHTQVPNVLLDVMMRDMNETELRVVLAICRFTFGWHKKEDEISLSKLKEITGLSRPGVIAGIEAGMKRGLIKRRSRGQGYVYRLRLVNSVDQASKDSLPELVNSVDQASKDSLPELVNSVDIQKKGKKDHYIESPSPPSTEPKNGAAAPGGGGDFFTELRKRRVGQAKAREIADRYPQEADRILRLIDASDPAYLGRTILDILDGVIDAPPARASSGAPLVATRPNMPDEPLPAAELARRLREMR